MKQIAIVIPAYNEEANIPALYAELEKVTGNLGEFRWEYIFVNDGSEDNSIQVLRRLAEKDGKIRVIDFSRNFGKEIALTAGMHAIFADAAICMDSDLQHPPDLIPKMVDAWQSGAEIVATIRLSTKDKPLMRRIGAAIFYWLLSKISGLDMVSSTTDFRLFDRKVIEAFRRVTERERMFRGIIDWMGFKKVYLEFHAAARTNGRESYSYKKLIRLAINSITSFSLFPLRVTGYLGCVITTVSGLLLSYMLYSKFYANPTLFTPLAIVVVINTFLMGIVLMAIGLVALYVGTIHTEVINRPLYIIRDRINFRSKDLPLPDAKPDQLIPLG